MAIKPSPRPRALLLPGLALCLLVPGAVAGQYSPTAGDRIRATAPGAFTLPVSGRVLETRDGATTIAGDGRGTVLVVPLHEIHSMAVSDGRAFARSAAIGAVAGLASGAVLGGVVGASVDSYDRAWGALVGTMAGGFTGVPFGALVGLGLAPEVWRPIPPLATPATTASAAAPLPSLRVEPGTTVRLVRAGEADRERVVVRSTADGTLVATGRAGELAVAWPDLARLEARGGRDRWRGAAMGAAALGGIGIVFGGIDLARDEIAAGEYVRATFWNAVSGGLVGYLIGAPGWTSVPLPP